MKLLSFLLIFTKFVWCLPLRTLPPIDVYTGNVLTKDYMSKEHIIPKRFFSCKNHADDLINLVPCDIHVNRIRSDYKYGISCMDSLQDPKIMEVYDNSHSISGYVNKRTRTFYPGKYTDYGILGRSIIELLRKYPYLYRNLLDIVESPIVLSIWCTYPVSEFELLRQKRIAR